MTKDFLKEKTFLYLLKSSSVKKTIRKIISQFGAPEIKMHMASSIEETLSILENHHVEIFFSDLEFNGKNTLPLHDLFDAKNPNSLQKLNAIICDTNSPSLACLAIDHNIDIAITMPMTREGVTSIITKIIEYKVHPSEELIRCQEIHQLIKRKKSHLADEALIELEALHPQSDNIQFLASVLARSKSEHNKELQKILSTLVQNEKHYLALTRAIDIYMEMNEYRPCYDLVVTLIQNYKVSSEKLMTVLMVFISNQNYEEIINFCETFMDFEDPSSWIRTRISAGLAISGKYLISEGKINRSKHALDKSYSLDSGNVFILECLVESYLNINKGDKAGKILARIPIEEKSSRLKVLSLKTDRHFHSPSNLLKLTTDLINQPIIDFDLYEMAVTASIEMGRKTSGINKLLEEAHKYYPHIMEIPSVKKLKAS